MTPETRSPEQDARRFGLRLSGIGLLLAILASGPVFALAGSKGLVSWWIGAGISLFNCLWGTLLICWGVRHGHMQFQLAVLGGFAGRLVVVLGAVAVIATSADVDLGVLLLSLMGFYFLGVVIEMRFLYRDVLKLGRPEARVEP